MVESYDSTIALRSDGNQALRGQVVTKGINIKDFVKNQPLFGVYWQYL